MKAILLSIVLTVLSLGNQDSATVRFANGDELSGHALAIGKDRISWQSSLLVEPADLKLSHILDVRLPSRLPSDDTPQPSHEAVLEITNGDVVKGALVAMNDREIMLNTWYAGKLVFPRLNVKSIRIQRVMKVFYRGPDNLGTWKISGNPESWALDNERFVASGSRGGIARDFDLPDEYEISFQFDWRGMLRGRMVFGSSDVHSIAPDTGYEMNFQSSMVNLRRLNDRNWLGTQSNLSAFRKNESAKIDVRVSKKTGKVLLYVDDEPAGIWSDASLKDSKGNGIHFISDMQMGNSQAAHSIAVSNIVVREWDGYLDEKVAGELLMKEQRMQGFNLGMREPSEPVKAPLPKGRMILANGDTIEGDVVGVDDEQIRLKTPFSEVSFPVYRLSSIPLESGEHETAKLENGDVRASLADGSKLVFRLDDVKDGKLLGFSQNFGHATFDQSAFKHIQFNLYPKKKAN
ncbi:MAG: hypothetical protein RL346_1948 [Verrucomicrobiota bacterium]|jgi:hypothetical protein